MPRTAYRLSDEIRQDVVRQYTTKLPDGTWKGSKMIARELGIAETSVQNVLRGAGIPIRTARESHAHGKRCGPIKHIEQLGDAPLCACGCNEPTYWVRSKYQWALYAQGHYRKDAPYKSQEWLLEQYVALKRSVPEIARVCGVNISTIVKFMNKFGIERRDARASHIGTQVGEKNPAWRGGATPLRQRLYKTQEWKELIRTVFARDKYLCQRCGKGISSNTKRAGAAHHIKSFAEHPELRFEMTNLVTLCRACHLWVHSRKNVARDFLE